MTIPGNGSKRILVVDDEEMNRKLLSLYLGKLGYEAVLAPGGKEALELLDASIDLVLLDVLMPGMDGFAVCRAIREGIRARDVPVIMVTALKSKEDRLQAVEAGANDFIAKPIDVTELRIRMRSLLRMKETQDEVKRYQAALEEMVSVRTDALRLAVENLKESQQTIRASHLETILRLSAAAEFKDEDTADHLARMSRYSARLAQKYGLHAGEVELVLQASPMHDIGKIGIPDSILLKPGKLSPTEWELMKRHTEFGAKILKESSFELLRAGEIIAMSHHERFDGSGYPLGLAGADIPVFGRICAVADVFDALTSKRPYKEAFSNEKSLEIMRAGRGSHFDPGILDLFFEHFDEIAIIQGMFEQAS